MAAFFNPRINRLWCRCSRLLLAISWTFGLIFGTVLSIDAGDILLPLMRSAEFGRVSIVSLLSVFLLPLLFSAVAVYLSFVWMLPMIAIIKGFFYSFLMCAYLMAADSSIHAYWLLLLCDSCVMPVLMLYWFRHVSGERMFRWAAILPTVLAAVCVGCVRYFYGSAIFGVP